MATPLTCRSLLTHLWPETLVARLHEVPPWQVGTPGNDPVWQPARSDDGEARWTTEDGLEIRSTVERPSSDAVVVRTVLCNTGDSRSRPIDTLAPLRLLFLRTQEEEFQVLRLGGGATDAYLPSRAYAEMRSVGRPGWSEIWQYGTGTADGRSSNELLPVGVFAIGVAGLAFAMEWSAEWAITMNRGWVEQPDYTVTLSIPVRQLTLEPGEELALPPVHIVASAAGIDGVCEAFRRHVYHHVCPRLDGKLPLPTVAYAHWFGIQTDFDSALLRRQVDWAAAAGLEYFELDAGWNVGGFGWGSGNWEAEDRERFPEGLDAFAAYVRERGLKMGLWFEPEKVASGTVLAVEHPEWCRTVPGSPVVPGRGVRMHLDLTQRGAQDWVIETLSRQIKRLDLKFLRWDYNVRPHGYWQSVDPSGKVMFRYLEGLDRVLDELLARHPDLLLECCASGGRRIDLGTLRRAHSCVISDHAHDADVCRFMQSGFNRLLPAHLASSSLAVPPHSTATERDIVSRMAGSLMFNGHVASWDEAWSARVRELVALYKEIRPLLVERFVRLLPQPWRAEEPEAFAFVAETGEEAIIFAFTAPNGRPLQSVQLPFVTAEHRYRVEHLLRGAPAQQLDGETLRESGLAVGLTTATAAGLWRVRRV